MRKTRKNGARWMVLLVAPATAVTTYLRYSVHLLTTHPPALSPKLSSPLSPRAARRSRAGPGAPAAARRSAGRHAKQTCVTCRGVASEPFSLRTASDSTGTGSRDERCTRRLSSAAHKVCLIRRPRRSTRTRGKSDPPRRGPGTAPDRRRQTPRRRQASTRPGSR